MTGAGRRAAAVLALAFGLLAGAGGLAASAAAVPAAASAAQYFGAEAANPSYGSSAFTQFYAAHTSSQVWLSGSVHCPAFYGAHVTWCGWLGNGTNHAQAGVNYTAYGHSYWLREDVYAPVYYGSLRCGARGNATVFVTYCNGVAG